MDTKRINIVDPYNGSITVGELYKNEEGSIQMRKLPSETINEEDLYVSPPWIDSHCHIYHGMTSFGLRPDDVGYKQGVHLLVDAGSSGEETVRGFREYVLPHYRTKVKAFLNISSIGLVTMQESFDMRKLDPDKTAACIEKNEDFLLGVKVRSSQVIVEDKGIEPLKRAVMAAEKAGKPIMIHMGENPPTNEENLQLLRKGDVLSHCFHGKDVKLWTEEGEPIPALQDAIERGVILDVAHGAASCSKFVAEAAIRRGYTDFIISTDLHGRNVKGPVYSLSYTMSKFMSFGLSLVEVIRNVTLKPAQVFGLDGWCDDLEKNCTVFRVRARKDDDHPFVDAVKNPIDVQKVIEPVAVIMDGEWIGL